MPDEQRPKLRRVGAIWKPNEGAKSKGSGSLTIGTLRQRFVIMPNDRKRPDSRDPDYYLLSADEPEVDDYAQKRAETRSDPGPGPEHEPGDDEEVPF